MRGTRSVRRPDRLLRLCIWLSTGLLFAMFHPGGMSIDSYAQLAQARSGSFGDWHPPFMAWLWRGAETIVRGPLPMLLAQLALFLACLRAFARQAFAGRRTAGLVFVLLTLWVTPVTGIVGVIWKDVWTSCLLLLAAAAMLSIGGANGRAARLARLAWGAAAMLGALLFRHNAVFAVLPLLVFGAWQLAAGAPAAAGNPASATVRGPVGDGAPPTAARRGSPVRRAAAALAIGVIGSAALMAAASAVNRALTARHEHPVQSILIYDLAGVAVLSGRTDLFDAAAGRLPDVLRGRPAVEIQALRAHYYPSTWTPLVFVEGSPLAVTASAAQVDALAVQWRRAVLEEPRAYLRHRAGVFLQVIGAHPGALFAPLYFGIPTSSPDHAEVSKTFRIDPDELAPVQRLLRRAFERAATLDVHRPWFWLGLNVLAIAAAALFSPRRAALAALGASGLFHELALFFIAPSADYRYSHWLVLSTWALLAVLAWEIACRRSARPAEALRRGSGTPAG